MCARARAPCVPPPRRPLPPCRRRPAPVIAASYTNLKLVLQAPLPRVFDTTEEGTAPLEAEPGIVGQAVSIEGVTAAAQEMRQKLQQEVLHPLEQWLAAYRTIKVGPADLCGGGGVHTAPTAAHPTGRQPGGGRARGCEGVCASCVCASCDAWPCGPSAGPPATWPTCSSVTVGASTTQHAPSAARAGAPGKHLP